MDRWDKDEPLSKWWESKTVEKKGTIKDPNHTASCVKHGGGGVMAWWRWCHGMVEVVSWHGGGGVMAWWRWCHGMVEVVSWHGGGGVMAWWRWCHGMVEVVSWHGGGGVMAWWRWCHGMVEVLSWHGGGGVMAWWRCCHGMVEVMAWWRWCHGMVEVMSWHGGGGVMAWWRWWHGGGGVMAWWRWCHGTVEVVSWHGGGGVMAWPCMTVSGTTLLMTSCVMTVAEWIRKGTKPSCLPIFTKMPPDSWEVLHIASGQWPKTPGQLSQGVYKGKEMESLRLLKSISRYKSDWTWISPAEEESKGRNSWNWLH